jgi:hypothetical protein
LHEFVVQQFLCSRPFRWIFLQAPRNEIPEDWREPVIDLRGLIHYYVIQRLGLASTDVGWLTLSYFERKYAIGPDVHFQIILFVQLYQLGSHPAEGAYLAYRPDLLFGKLGGISEVGQLNVTVGIDEDVVTLDVPVDYAS